MNRNTLVLLAVGMLLLTAFQKSELPTPEEVVLRHLASFQENDLEAVMNDYSESSVLITPGAVHRGLDEIRSFLSELATHFPTGRSRLVLEKMVVEGNLVYILWYADTPTLQVSLGTDTFIVRDGKIVQQTFAGSLTFLKNP